MRVTRYPALIAYGVRWDMSDAEITDRHAQAVAEGAPADACYKRAGEWVRLRDFPPSEHQRVTELLRGLCQSQPLLAMSTT